MKNYGLISVEPTKKDYVFEGKVRLGGLPLRPDGQWDDYLPVFEKQNLGVETYACTVFGTLNAVEILLRQEFGNRENLSDRFLAKMCNIQPPGANPNTAPEKLRKFGCPEEADYPSTKELNTWEKFYSEIPENIKTLALEFKAEFDFGHEWVSPDYDSMKEALKYSPLGVGVYAWEKDAKGYYIRPPKAQDVHWVCCYGYVDGEYWKVFDSYPDSDGVYLKKLDWNFGFSMVKKYSLHRTVIVESFWSLFVRQLRAILGL